MKQGMAFSIYGAVGMCRSGGKEAKRERLTGKKL